MLAFFTKNKESEHLYIPRISRTVTSC